MGNKISKKERQQREAEAKQKEQRSNRRYFMMMAALMLIAAWGAGYLFNGAAVNTLPQRDELAQISITDVRYAEDATVVTGKENLKNSCAVLSLLRVKLGEAEMTEEPIITVTYQMKDGTEKELLLGETHMRWDGKDYQLKQRAYKMFLDIEPAYFFPEQINSES